MTNELVRRYNAKYKGAAPAKKADGKKAAPAATPAPK
jgi:hypothetical protein